MPYSYNNFDNHIENFIKKNRFNKYLDIGAGAGKYGKLIKQINENFHIEAIEINKEYISKFELDKYYNKIYNIDASKFINTNKNYSCDICIIGDCIEHLKKSEGIDLLNFLVYRCKYILVAYPVKFIQNGAHNTDHESHISVWSKHDFSSFDFKLRKIGRIELYTIKGYLLKK